MFKHVINGVSIASILDKRRANPDGNYPVRIKVHFQKDKKYYSTGKVCSESEWERMPTVKAKELVEVREEIQICFDLIRKHVLDCWRKTNSACRIWTEV